MLAVLNFLTSTLGERLMQALEVTWKGMLAIFVVIGILVVIVVILNKIGSKKNKE